VTLLSFQHFLVTWDPECGPIWSPFAEQMMVQRTGCLMRLTKKQGKKIPPWSMEWFLPCVCQSVSTIYLDHNVIYNLTCQRIAGNLRVFLPGNSMDLSTIGLTVRLPITLTKNLPVTWTIISPVTLMFFSMFGWTICLTVPPEKPGFPLE